jgi:hypothetical protein
MRTAKNADSLAAGYARRLKFHRKPSSQRKNALTTRATVSAFLKREDMLRLFLVVRYRRT